MSTPPATILPPNATALERAIDRLGALRLAAIDTPLRALWSAQDCPEHLLPWLAWGLSLDQWDTSWPLYIRRARVASAIAIQRRKGTAQSVRDLIASFGGNVTLREWFEMNPPGAPYTFSLSVSLGGQMAAPTPDFIETVIAEVARTKPARCHFDFTVAQSARAELAIKALARPVAYARLWCQA